MRGGFGGEWIHVYVWPSPFAAHLKLPQHGQSSLPQYKIKSLKLQKRILEWVAIHFSRGPS